MVSPDERFAALVVAFLGDPDVTPPESGIQTANRFGANGLKTKGKIFAMLVRGRLVVKLPRQQVDAYVAHGDGERFDVRNNGHPMKEWLVLAPDSPVDWLSLANEAKRFVAGAS